MMMSSSIWQPDPYGDPYNIKELEQDDPIGYRIPYLISRRDVIKLLLELMSQQVAGGEELHDYTVRLGHPPTTFETVIVIRNADLSRAFERRIEALVTGRNLPTQEFVRFDGDTALRPLKGDERIDSVSISLCDFV